MKKYDPKRGWLFPFGAFELRLPYDGKTYETAQAMADALPAHVTLYDYDPQGDPIRAHVWGKRPWMAGDGFTRRQVKCKGISIPGWQYVEQLSFGPLKTVDPDAWDQGWKELVGAGTIQ